MESKQNSTKFFGMRHVQVFLWFMGNTIAFVMISCMSVAIVAMTDNESNNSGAPTFQWSPSTQSLILSSSLWGAMVAQLPICFLVLNGGSSKLFCYGILLCGIVSVLIPILAVNFNWIAVLICRILMGIGQGCLMPCLTMLLAQWVPSTERAFLASFVLNSPQIGSVISMALSGILANTNLGWPSIFYTCGSAGILWSIAFYWLGADSPSTHKSITLKEKEYIESSCGYSNDVMDKNTKVPWRAILTSLPVWAGLCAKCAHLWSYYMLLSEMPTFMKSVLKFDIAQSGTISSIPYIAKWLFAFPIGWASDFALRKGAPITVVRKISNSIGMWGPALALLILCLLRTTNQAISVTLLTLAVGLNAGVMCGQEITELDICPNFSGIVTTITNTIAKIFGIAAQLSIGIIITNFKNLDQWLIIFYISVVMYFIGNLVFVVFGKSEKQSWNDQSSPTQPWDSQTPRKLFLK